MRTAAASSCGVRTHLRGDGPGRVAFGLLLGAAHGAFAGGGLLNVLLPVVHPRMGRSWTDARSTPLLEPPGFLLSNYGRATLVATFVLHLAYGAIVGTFASL